MIGQTRALKDPREYGMEAVLSLLGCDRAAGDSMQSSADPKRHAIIVDDDVGICKALSFTMQKLGFETAQAASPAQLDDALAARTPELIFLDLSLGQSGAMDVLPILARRGYAGYVQLMSGRSQAVMDQVAAAGDEFGLKMLPALPKPFRMTVVKDVVAGLNRTQ